jgi:hypothetical protein
MYNSNLNELNETQTNYNNYIYNEQNIQFQLNERNQSNYMFR